MFEVSLSSKAKVARDGASGFNLSGLTEPVLQTQSSLFRHRAYARFMYAESEKKKFASSKAILGISIGQPAHEGDKLAAIVELVNKNFASCDVAVGDSLQRHTLQMAGDLDQPSRIDGKAWVQRNKAALQLLTIPHRIFHWDEYLMDPNFEACHKRILNAYQESKIFAKAMDETIKEFIERQQGRSNVFDLQKAFDGCFNYLAEECTVMMLMWPKYGYNYLVYPNDMPRALKASHDQFVLPVYPKLLQWLRVRIRTRAPYKQSVADEALEH